MAEKIDLRKLLVIPGRILDEAGVLEYLSEHFNVELAGDSEQARESIRKGNIDAVLAETGEFLPLERNLVSQAASVVLDTLGDGVCIVRPDGKFLWGNRRVQSFQPAALEQISSVCLQAYKEFAAAPTVESDRGQRYSFTLADGKYYEVVCSALRDSSGLASHVAAVVINATARQRQQQKLDAIDLAGRELVRLDYQALRRRDASERLDLLKERIISCSRGVLDYEHFAVLVLSKKANRLDLLVYEGLDTHSAVFNLLASTIDNGICGYVAATGRSYICQETRVDPHYVPGLANARSSLTVPLLLQDEVVGVLNVESSTPAAFSEDDRQFAEIFGNYVALALNTLDLLVHERHNVHTEVSDSICSELRSPLNDIITCASDILEDYIGHDDLRKRLEQLIDRASQARRFIQDLGRGATVGLVQGSSSTIQPDPLLVGRKILVADDEEFIRQTVSDILKPYGCDVDLACNGLEAIELVKKSQYDLVITDIKMPGASGYEVFAAAKEAANETQIILITAFGYDPSHAIVRANQEGLAAVLMNPFKVNQLLQECRQALSGARD